MPADFVNCVKHKGRVRTKKLKNGKYMHLCLDKQGTHAGEVKNGSRAESAKE